jgi:Cu(I)/Ag(I) efflux system membrane protein CusA/SilA
VTSFLLELLVYPAVYLLWRWHTEVRHAAATGATAAAGPLVAADAAVS